MSQSRGPLRSLFSGETYASRWEPAADVYRMTDGWLVKVELAGVRPDEFEVRVSEHQLILRGRRRDWHLSESGQCQSLEIAYAEFERRFEFPIDLTRAHVDTDCANGMLLLRIREAGTRS
jgi:HSP20 family protein